MRLVAVILLVAGALLLVPFDGPVTEYVRTQRAVTKIGAEHAASKAVTDQFSGKYASAWYPIAYTTLPLSFVLRAIAGGAAIGGALTLTVVVLARRRRASDAP